ncbi:MAG: aminodeoxychorismate synthase component I [Clostridium sp.]|nr:aminodeoxychorismate synthase component I [Clostridium sp.]
MAVSIKKLDKYISAQIIFDKVKDYKSVFLDSSKTGELGKYSIIGIEPYLELKEEEAVLYINGKKTEEALENYLSQYLKDNREENNSNLPIISGGIGYFSYDYGRKIEKITSRHKKDIDIPDAMVTFYDNFIIEDIENQNIYIVSNGKLKPSEESLEYLEKIINNEYNLGSKEKAQSFINRSINKEQYLEMIDMVRDYIERGHIYVMNLTHQIVVNSSREPYEVFKILQKNNKAPFSAYIKGENFEIISASPERFIRIKNQIIETRPIKGTRKRGDTKEEDEILKLELENSEKDKSELLMIVDLERNDLNKICIPGTVKVRELFKMETYATVFHLVADVIGRLRDDFTIVDILKAVFPGGSITGAPKVRAMEIIDELENSQRGIYTGIIGYISLNGDCDFNIAIRTAIHKDGEYHIGVGGGITYESEKEFEYEETWQKAKALLDAIML